MSSKTINLDRDTGRLVRTATQSNIDVKTFYSPEDYGNINYEKELGDPGSYPFTRGLYRDMYRARLWLKSFIVSYSTVQETNEAFRKYFEAGMNDLRLGTDLTGQVGLDPDHPSAWNALQCSGPAGYAMPVYEKMLEGIDLSKGVYELGDSNIASPLFRYACLVAIMEKQGLDSTKIRGNAVNDPVRAKLVFGINDFTTEINKRIVLDQIEFSKRETPNWHPFSPNGVDLNQSGMDAICELGGILALGETIIRELQAEKSISIDDFGPMVFSMDADSDFFENIAKFRVARKMWAKIAKEKFGAATERAMKLKIGIRTSGLSLQEQNPLNNSARVAFQILSCVLGGVNSIDASSIDEALGLPSWEARMYSLNTQHIIAHETNVPLVGDPLGGSYYLEWLTDKLERETVKYMEEIEKNGGIFECLDSGFLKDKMESSRLKMLKEKHDKERLIIGVNAFHYEEGPINQAIRETAYNAPSVETRKKTLEEITKFKANRDIEDLKQALAVLYRATRNNENMVRPVIEAVKKGMTLGEMVGVIRLGYGLQYDNLGQIEAPRMIREMLKECE